MLSEASGGPGQRATTGSSNIRIAMFTGGRGSTSITRSLLKNPAISLTNLINGYDDGLSTGRLRTLLPGYLGPSDFRKNIITMAPTDNRPSRSLKQLFEYRFPVTSTQKEIVETLEAIAHSHEAPVAELQQYLINLIVRTEQNLRKMLQAFLGIYHEKSAEGNEFDLRDASFGNLLMTGEYLLKRRSFNAMVASISDLCAIRGKVTNVSEGENLYLVGLKEDGIVLKSEAMVVGPQSRVKIKELYLLPEPLTDTTADRLASLPIDQREQQLVAMNQTVDAGRECVEALETADLIIYAPGTQNSSLLPSYLSVGVGETIAANTTARKIFVSNLREDHEIPEATADSLIESCVWYLNRRGDLSFSTRDYITDVFVHKDISSIEKQAHYLSFNFDSPGYESLRIKEIDWEARHVPGLHNGDQVATQIHNVVRQQRSVDDFYYTVSIIVPALNEERTIGGAVRDLKEVGAWGLGVEVVIVDGGSTDRTLEEAQKVPGVKAYRLPEGTFGRGAAIKYGLSMTVSDLVVIFPADMEYKATDIRRLLRPLLAKDCEVTLGARNLRPHSVEESLLKIYRHRRMLYYTSLAGGRTLSLLTFLLYNRFVSDPLTSARAFLGHRIRRLDTKGQGFDYDQEVLGILLRQDATIFEIPVSFRPRTRAEGKKIRLSDGVKAVWALVRTRFRRLPVSPAP